MNAYELPSSQIKLVMWYKCKEMYEGGKTKAQISRDTGLDRKTVRKYLSMSCDDFIRSQSYNRTYPHILDPYERYVKDSLTGCTDLSASQIHDRLRERYADFPQVDAKTVFNYVKHIRAKYRIGKPSPSSPRQYNLAEETRYGEFAQADFGEKWMRRGDGRKLKVYFFVMIMCRSRKKYTYFSRAPFTAEMAVYAHEKAFEYYGGKPEKIIYDQDAILIHNENLGDYILTKSFQAFVGRERFKCVFCRKSDPESKGKVENAVKYVKYNFLRGRTFDDVGRLNAEAILWLSRTANGLPHCGTRLVPDEVFAEEKGHLAPYRGRPMMPQRTSCEHAVHKTNSISYCGNEYSLPTGSYHGQGSRVWVSVNDGSMEVYDNDTGKQLAVHRISQEKGKCIVDPSHRPVRHASADDQENEVLSYCGQDSLASAWMRRLKEEKPRYYKDNLRVLSREMRHYWPDTLHRAFDRCIDAGMYNAKDLTSLCGRIGKRIPADGERSPSGVDLPDAINEAPDKTPVSTYNIYFE